ncbi:uncharacterized protein LOC125769486 [Anopheles funestus]|uniref:uncharacterized protein LOC125769486 n=1 Tax=Anopheles funestus TaxID=62324 RepID=UPI0020C636C5|nr:uncharacterized protein LOC125769486 [Anopheles funestus]
MSSSNDSNIYRRRKRNLEELEQQTDAEWSQLSFKTRPDGSIEIPWPNMSSDEPVNTNNGDGESANNFLEGDFGTNIDDNLGSLGIDSDHLDADRDGDDNITAGLGTAYSFLEKLTGTEALRY